MPRNNSCKGYAIKFLDHVNLWFTTKESAVDYMSDLRRQGFTNALGVYPATFVEGGDLIWEDNPIPGRCIAVV